ncbi:hypothetical protein G7Z17_g8788 [Cylindrodendrum hubeiense]|uniref:Uncharacterized protein n=1 Tax=Cylindrodendrum hubeiense TaxID=595255 RepID=A0A9P5LE01_9HYPO|nr:hypothetical protein G7Z17_g8788 [Cylindrodendrum hubeiense]
MEARSLTSVNNLASNPPQYPVNPTDERQDPLVLYISRVPGTRDVILSPFKPQLKIVSSEDVASSLYYIHLEAPSSDLSASAAPQDDGFRSSSDEGSSARNIPRKPLPETAKPLASPSRDFLPVPGNENNDPMRPRGHTVSFASDAARSAPPRYDQDGRLSLDSQAAEPRPQASSVRRTATVSRRPLGPRGPRAIRTPPTPNADKPLPAFPPLSPTNDGERVPAHASNSKRRSFASRSPSPRKQGETSFTNPFTLALIRRDPSTGNQWNVGHVSSYQSEAAAAVEQDDFGPFLPNVPPVQSPAANPPINIQIETLGYGRFRNMPARKSFDSGPGDGIPTDAKVPRSEGAVLSRQVLMGYTKTMRTNWREKWNQESRHERGRHGSVTSVDSTGSADLAPEPQTTLGQPGPGMRPRGYVFTSPWNGRCEFRTGTTGRSVRCYHILHDNQPAALNTLMDQGVPIPQQFVGSMALSELRFNLPSVELFKSPEGREEVKTQIQGHFNKLLQKFDERTNRNNDYDDGMVSPFDVNLGKEKAGGGNRGKRAKMGKLIIYPDGLKMLDLVVAANMGVWWGAWEKSF